MKREDLKYILIFASIAYGILRIYDSFCFEYLLDSKNDFQVAIIIMLFITLYILSKEFFILKPRQIMKLNPITPLEYKIISDNDFYQMKKIYVRSINSFVWKELDYPYAVKQGCDLNRAVQFTDKVTTGQTFIDVFKEHNNKFTQEEEKTNSDLTYSLSLIFFIMTIIMVILYFLEYA